MNCEELMIETINEEIKIIDGAIDIISEDDYEEGDSRPALRYLMKVKGKLQTQLFLSSL